MKVPREIKEKLAGDLADVKYRIKEAKGIISYSKQTQETAEQELKSATEKEKELEEFARSIGVNPSDLLVEEGEAWNGELPDFLLDAERNEELVNGFDDDEGDSNVRLAGSN